MTLESLIQSIKDAVRLARLLFFAKGDLKINRIWGETARYETAVSNKYDRVTKERII
jgi:hypothetical protein